jgi:aspartate/methionine/tyrosine aminotransferase
MSAKMVNPWALHRVAAARKAAGEKVVLLGMGEPDTPSHPAALKALTAAVAAGEEGYAPALGLPELRAAIAERIGIGGSPDAVHLTCGGQTALYLAVATLCQRFKDRHGSSTKYGKLKRQHSV